MQINFNAILQNGVEKIIVGFWIGLGLSLAQLALKYIPMLPRF